MIKRLTIIIKSNNNNNKYIQIKSWEKNKTNENS